MKIVINRCWGGFGLSDAAYEKLIELGVQVRAYVEQERDPVTGLYKAQPANEGDVIFDRTITPNSTFCDEQHIRLMGRYWDTWLSQNRTHPLLVRAVEELGSAASGSLSKLHIVEIPDGIDYEIDDYDGMERVHELHRSWS